MQKRQGHDEFRAFYERLQPRAVAAATRLVQNRQLAEDIAAESFARAFASWSRVRKHPNPDAWLLRVVGNVSIDQIRRESRRPELESRSSTGHIAADPVGERTELQIDLTDALHRLSGRQRDVVVMRYLIDLSEEETAAGLGMSTGSVKTHLHRATKKLRSDLIGADAAATSGPASTATSTATSTAPSTGGER